MIYVSRVDGKVIGKFSEEEFRAKISAGDISPDDQYLGEGAQQWRRASEFPGATFPKLDRREEVLPPLTKRPQPLKNEKEFSPAKTGGLCAIAAAIAPLLHPFCFFLVSLPLLIAAFVLAIVSIVRGKVGSGVLLLAGLFIAMPFSCMSLVDRDKLLRHEQAH